MVTLHVPFRVSRAACVFGVAATWFVTACSKTPPKPAGGLELIIAADGLSAPTDFDDIRLEVSQQFDGGSWNKLWDRDYVVPSQEATLPTTFAVVAGSGVDQEVLISVTAFKGGPVVQRVAQVQAPTDRVAALWLVLAEVCRGQVMVAGAEGEPLSTCPIAGQSCQPSTGGCGSSVISDPGGLPTYVPGESLDAAPEGAVVAPTIDASGAEDAAGTDAALTRDSTGDVAKTEASDGAAAATDTTPASDSPSDAVGTGPLDGSEAETGTVEALALAAGSDQTCAILSGGLVRCWGLNPLSKLGYDTTPVAVSNLSGATAIAGGSFYACAVLSGGTVECWGSNNYGDLGNGTTTGNSTPMAVSTVSGATALAAPSSGSHTCALVSAGTAQCWGDNQYGQLGNGTANIDGGSNSSVPVAVASLSGAIAIAAGLFHTCAALSDGTVKCWGYNRNGYLGSGSTTDSSTPVVVSNLTGAIAVAAGNSHSCALLSSGTVQCWGSGAAGQLGDGPTTLSLTPVPVSNLSGATALAAGSAHTCAVLAGGAVQCWGFNGSGQLGNGTTTDSSTPVVVSNLSGATAIAAGLGHTCALLSGGRVQCWGDNSSGQLGNGTTISSPTPVAVAW